MQRAWLILAAAALCSCHPVRRDPVRRSVDSSPGVIISDPPPAPLGSASANKGPTPEPRAEVPAPVPESRPEPGIVIARLNQQLRDAYFDYDRAEVRPDAVTSLEADARLLAPILAEFPEVRILVEGHCDERGSAEYNLGLGANRANRAADLLQRFGILSERVETISYGKEAPQCSQATEACWQRNRRAHLVVTNAPR